MNKKYTRNNKTNKSIKRVQIEEIKYNDIDTINQFLKTIKKETFINIIYFNNSAFILYLKEFYE